MLVCSAAAFCGGVENHPPTATPSTLTFDSPTFPSLRVFKLIQKPRKGNGRRRGGGGPKAQALGTRAGAAAAAATRARKISNVKPAVVAPQQIAEKIMVSGLPLDVSASQIKVGFVFFRSFL